MRTTAHIAKSVATPRIGLLATLRGLPRSQGSGAPSRTPVLAILAALLTLLGSALTAAPALALPEGRVYEQVSPEFKGGYGAADILGVEPGGEAVAFGSAGIFSGAASDKGFVYYQASRSGSGWSTASLMPAASFAPSGGFLGFSPSLGASLWELTVGAKNTSGDTSEVQYSAHASGAPVTQAGFQAVGPVLKSLNGETLGEQNGLEGFSADLCHVVIRSLLPLAGEGGDNIFQAYDLSAGCHGEPSYQRVVGLNSAGGLLSDVCQTHVGYSYGNGFNAVSGDGSEVFFNVVPGTDETKCLDGHEQVFVRVGGVRTLEVSKPLGECAGGEVPCGGGASRPGARFWGASEDGSRVFFSTAAPLTGGTDTSVNLYMARIGCPGEAEGCEAGQRVVTGLVQVSSDSSVGQAAEVQGVVGVAPDGSRVYFVARGVLSEAANQQGLVARDGADNLYVYDAGTGQAAFVGDLCSGPELSGVVASAACPDDLEAEGAHTTRNDSELWSNFPLSLAQTAGGDGRFLVFSSYARLIVSGPEADADDAQDVYRYDAQTGVLQRVSLGEAGADGNGNASDEGKVIGEINGIGVGGPGGPADARIQPATQNVIGEEERGGVRRASSEDGSRVVFVSAEPLSPLAINGVENVYEWHDGVVSMVSCGCALEPDREPVITPSGRDIFFDTTAELVPGDTDGAADVYDARLGGGFPLPPAGQEECSGDGCQGPLTNPAPLLVPGSAVQAPGGNLAAPVAPAVVKSKAKPRTVKCGKGRVRRKGRCVKRAGRRKGHRAVKSNGRAR
ncbi:MAG TPA: hypothetical protein VIJ66_12120 [Solirubrobacteraceae bacterium]